MTASLLVNPGVRKALSDVDWAPATVDPIPGRQAPPDSPVFGSAYTPEPTDERSVTITVPEATSDRMEAAIARIDELAALDSNWDSYGGLPLQPGAALHAIRLLAAILQNDVPLPSIVPTSEGGLQLEWHASNTSLEMEVSTDRTVRVFSLMRSGSTWEGRLANNQWRLEAFLSQLMSEE